MFPVDKYKLHGLGPWLTKWADRHDLPEDFLYDVAVSLLDERPRSPVSLFMQEPGRYYHPGMKTRSRS